MNDRVYTPAHPSGLACIDVVEQMDYCSGRAVWLLWHQPDKDDYQEAGELLDRLLGTDSSGLRPATNKALEHMALRMSEASRCWRDVAMWHIIEGVATGSDGHLMAARNMVSQHTHLARGDCTCAQRSLQ